MKYELKVENSSTIGSLEYDRDTAILSVKFKSGAEYYYEEVPAETATALFESESKGKYFAAHIKNKFDTKKVHGSDVVAAWPFPTYNKP